MYGQLTFDKGGKSIQWKKVSLANGAGELDSHCSRVKLDHFLAPYTKINSKWMEYLNVKQGAIKMLEEKAGKTSLTLAAAAS